MRGALKALVVDLKSSSYCSEHSKLLADLKRQLMIFKTAATGGSRDNNSAWLTSERF